MCARGQQSIFQLIPEKLPIHIVCIRWARRRLTANEIRKQRIKPITMWMCKSFTAKHVYIGVGILQYTIHTPYQWMDSKLSIGRHTGDSLGKNFKCTWNKRPIIKYVWVSIIKQMHIIYILLCMHVCRLHNSSSRW